MIRLPAILDLTLIEGMGIKVTANTVIEIVEVEVSEYACMVTSGLQRLLRRLV